MRTTRLDTLKWLLSVLTKLGRVRVYYCRSDNSIRIQMYLRKKFAETLTNIKKFEIPRFIADCRKEIVSSFIAGLFDSDGTIQIYKKTDAPTSIVNMRIVPTRMEFLRELQKLMKSGLGLETTIREQRSSSKL